MRTLLLTLGTTPQVVTETYYALATRDPSFIADEVHLITTSEGSRQAQLRLLGPDSIDGGQLARLCADLGTRVPAVVLHLITDADGHAMDDIRTVLDQDQAANQILAVVRRLTEDHNRALHVSLAGGRKTMGFYLAYSLSLYGRECDELSHVLVNAPFENHPEFFYPPKRPRILPLPNSSKTASTDNARITLAPIPYVRLRGLLPEALITERHDYRDLVHRTQARIEDTLDLYLDDRVAIHAGIRIPLSDTAFLWLYWFSARAGSRQPGVQAQEPCRADVLNHAYRLVGHELAGTGLANLEKAFDGDCLNRDNLQVQISRLNKKLAAHLGPRTRLRVVKEGRHSQSRYRLSLPADAIRIHE